MPGRHLQIAGDPLYAESAGRGEPVLLLHGGGASLHDLSVPATALAGEYTVHGYERPGHGRSPDRPGGFDYDSWCEQAVGVLDALDVPSAHLVGHSDGGIIALLVALRYPHRVRSLVTISANLDPTGLHLSADELAAAVAAAGHPGADTPLADRLRWLWLTAPQITPAELAAITVPALVVAGDRDSIRPAHTRAIAAAIPGAELVLVPNATHGLVTEHAERLTGVLLAFLRAASRSGG